MEFASYYRILRKRWWIIVVAVVFTAASALIFSRLQTPRYTSTAEVIIEPARPDWGLAQAAKMVLRSYMTVADSDKWAQDVIDILQLSTTPQRLRSDVNFAAEDDRMVIKIEVEDYDGDVANDVARTWAELLVQWRNQKNAEQRKEDQVFAELRDLPQYGRTWPPSGQITLLGGAILGLVIAGVVIFFLEWVEAGVLRSPQDVEQELGLAVVGAIPPAD
jgi:capsular polysaccharide biosynthesis protein